MNESKEKLLDLLSRRAIYGLSETEQENLDELIKTHPEFLDDESFEMTAAYVNLASLERVEPMPDILKNRILADAGNFFGGAQAEKTETVQTSESDSLPERDFAAPPPPRVPFWQKLGWAFAAVAAAILAVNIWQTRVSPPVRPEYVQVTPTPTPSLAEQRAELLNANDLVQSKWTAPPTAADQSVSGDVVWSDAAQQGFVRIKGLPVNDKTEETYQLWVFEEGQGSATPVSAGTFDVNSAGELVLPLDAEIKVRHPKKFAVTVEKPGGVVVSKLKKIAAVAKVET